MRKSLKVVTIGGGSSYSPDDGMIEVGYVIAKDRPIQSHVGEVSTGALGIVQNLKAYEIVAAKAEVTGDYGQAILAIMMYPFVLSETVAKPLLDDMFDTHKEFMPQFFKANN